MGLDMHLTGKRFISKHFNEGDDERAEAIRKLFPELAGGAEPGSHCSVKEVQIEAGYWRKANAIHNWFVNNVQDGEDECRPFPVFREQLEQLKTVCEQVIENPKLGPELLPTASGFFFGSTDYGEYYIDDLKQTVQIINDALDLPDSWEFEYRSSW